MHRRCDACGDVLTNPCYYNSQMAVVCATCHPLEAAVDAKLATLREQTRTHDMGSPGAYDETQARLAYRPPSA